MNTQCRARVVRTQMIWDASPYNAFTSLARFNDTFFCAFREGSTHLSADGAIRVLSSPDGRSWQSAARLAWPNGDARDAKLSISPDGGLLLHSGVLLQNPKMIRTVVWSSRDGRNWGDGLEIGDPGIWLWGISWNEGVGYGMGYGEALGGSVRLHATTDGVHYETRVPHVPVEGNPSEHAMAFMEDGRAVCVLRRDGPGPRSGMIGVSSPPYTHWQWNDAGRYTGGPAILRIPDGRLVANVRFIDDRQFQRIGLCRVDPEQLTLTEFLVLPGAQERGPVHPMGDWGYAGMVWHDGKLWTSYYSPHEGRCSIYISEIEIDAR